MKKILFALIILSGLFYSSSCSNDFELTTDWKDIPIVYGILSRSDTAHYVRVEKAFLDPETNAFELAQVVDSLYYPNATVRLVRLSDNKEYFLTKVDGAQEGYPRDTDGPFATTPNWLYKLKLTGAADTLMPGEEYQIIVNRSETATPVTSTITVVDDIQIQSPNFASSLSFFNLNGEPIKVNFRWGFNDENTFIFDASMVFYYQEQVNGEWQDRSFVWPLVESFEPDDGAIRYTVPIESNAFYQAIASALNDAPEVNRRFRYLEFMVTGANESFYEYIQVNKVNTGITSAQLIPNFTNMSEGFGLYASKHTQIQSHELSLASRDSLIDGQYTRHLGFQ